MGLLFREIEELRKMDKQYVKGTINSEHVVTRMSIYSQVEKREKMILQAHALEARFGRRTLSKLIKSNFFGDGEAIDINADVETEKIKCPEKDYQLITRAECLDCSGSHNKECKGCEHKTITQNILLGPAIKGQ